MAETGTMQKTGTGVFVGPGRLRGDLLVPQSKSIAHRAVICSALARRTLADGLPLTGLLHIDRIDTGPASSLSMDIAATREAMVRLLHGGTEVYCGESGSTLRFLIPVAAALGRTVTFTGSGRLPERPLGEYGHILEGKGVHLEFPGDKGLFLPLRIHGELTSGTFDVPGDVSSQYITGLLLALPLLRGDSAIRITSPLESAAYIDLTLEVMRAFGVRAGRDAADGMMFRIPGGQRYQDVDYTVEGDYSQAAFWLTANLLGSRISLQGLDPSSAQGDRQIEDVLAAYRSIHRPASPEEPGLPSIEDRGVSAGSDGTPVGEVQPGRSTSGADGSSHRCVRTNASGEIEIDASQIPDLVPILCVAAANTPVRTRIVHAGRLRLKESDRIASSVALINAIGGSAEETDDGILLAGSDRPLRGGYVDSAGDHRIAMAAAIAATVTREGVTISDPRCVNKSYPDFFKDLAQTEGVVYGIDLRKKS